MRNMRYLLLCLLAAATLATAQEFEVVSIKPDHSGSNNTGTQNDPGRFTATGTNLRSLIQMAYSVADYQIEGPEWLRTERYDIAAKFAEELPKDPEKYYAGLSAMVRHMLADRFRLVLHREQKTMAVYALMVSKKGIQFQEAPEGHPGSNSSNGHFQGVHISMGSFARFLSRQVGMPVLDMTGLKGFYNLTLDFVREAAKADAPAGLELPEALQEQLGLRLESRKAPIEILIVDHAEKTPVEN